MTRRFCITSLVGINGVLLAMLLATPSSAHDADTYYPEHWNFNEDVNYYYDPPVPDSFRPQINEGFNKWSDRAGGEAPNFNPQGVRQMEGPYTKCGGPNGVFYRNVNSDGYGNSIGLTGLCVQYDRVEGFSMVFDTEPDYGPGTAWYAGDGTVPDNRWDIQSIATHEAGHSTGFSGGWTGHFPEGSTCEGPDRQTMCPGSTEAAGTKYIRTLEAHDVHTIEAAYHTNNPCPPVC